MKKLIAVFLLASLFVLTLFTSCAVNKNNNNDNTKKTDDGKIEINDKNIFYAAYPKDLQNMQFSKIYTFDSKAENAKEVIGLCTKDITDIKLYSASFNTESEKFSLTKELYTQQKLIPGEALLMKILIPEGIPNMVISFTDADKKAYNYSVGYNGKDGTVKLEEVNVEAATENANNAAAS